MIETNLDAGSKSIYETVTSLLVGDATLRNMVRYKESDPNIGRGWATTGKWTKLIRYFMHPETVMTDFSPNIRRLILVVNIYSRENELDMNDIAERVIELLDRADLTKKGKTFVYNVSYMGELINCVFNNELQSHIKALQFQVIFRKELA